MTTANDDRARAVLAGHYEEHGFLVRAAWVRSGDLTGINDVNPAIAAMHEYAETLAAEREAAAVERCARVADRMAAAAATVLERGRDDDAAAQLDTSTEIATAIRESRHAE